METTNRPLAVLLAVHNRLELTQRCVSALRRAARGWQLRLVIVDDGSTDGTRQWLDAQPEVEVMAGGGNLWFGGATDLGLRHIIERHGDCSHVLVLNNDTFVREEAIERMINAAIDDHHVVAAAFWIEDHGRAGSAGFVWQTWWLRDIVLTTRWIEAQAKGGHDFLAVYAVSTALTLIPLPLLKNVVLPDPDMHPHHRYDAMLSARMRQAGARFLCSRPLLAEHHLGPTANRPTVRAMTRQEFMRASFEDRVSVYHVRCNLDLISEAAPNWIAAVLAVVRLFGLFVRQLVWTTFNTFLQRPVRAGATTP
jgi:N-acetylglucosaminyl-diphospho-decaprenol L-rhamnosyltransferase